MQQREVFQQERESHQRTQGMKKNNVRKKLMPHLAWHIMMFMHMGEKEKETFIISKTFLTLIATRKNFCLLKTHSKLAMKEK